MTSPTPSFSSQHQKYMEAPELLICFEFILHFLEMCVNDIPRRDREKKIHLNLHPTLPLSGKHVFYCH